MNSMKLLIPLHFISWRKTPDDAVTPKRQSQFTPNINAVLRLLSSFVWIDLYNECNRMTSFMEFMLLQLYDFTFRVILCYFSFNHPVISLHNDLFITTLASTRVLHLTVFPIIPCYTMTKYQPLDPNTCIIHEYLS